MRRKLVVILSILVTSLFLTPAVFANAPAQGTVVEGQSVPGFSLGDNRAVVEAAYGDPSSCQNMSYYDGRQGIDGICMFDVDGGGQVTVYLFAPDGGPAKGNHNDVASTVRWSQQVSGWMTTAGVNTTLALNDRDAVAAAYPNAVVTVNPLFGNIIQVKDYEQGIEINWHDNVYSGTTTVDILITGPSEAPPPRVPMTHIESIELSASKTRGQRTVVALVRVQNDYQLAAKGALVSAFWTLPDGSTLPVIDLTSSTGYAYFAISNASRGTYTLTITNVELADHIFDSDGSTLSTSIRVQ